MTNPRIIFISIACLILIAAIAISFQEKKVSDDFLKQVSNKSKNKSQSPTLPSNNSIPKTTHSKIPNQTINVKAPAIPLNKISVKPGIGFEKTNLPDSFNKNKVKNAAIAQWNLIPFEKVNHGNIIGVLAFHAHGIRHVKFSVNGSKWVIVDKMTFNPYSKTNEYCLALDLSEFSGKEISLRAISVPILGENRNLPNISLLYEKNLTAPKKIYISNIKGKPQHDGSFSKPFMDINQALKLANPNDTIIIIDPGVYFLENMSFKKMNTKGWITIKAVKTLPKHSVTIKTPNRKFIRQKLDFIKWKNISFDFDSIIQYQPGKGMSVWFDQCKFFNSKGYHKTYPGGILTPVTPTGRIKGSYITNSFATQMLYGFPHVTLVRGCTIRDIIGDALTNNKLSINNIIENMDGTTSTFHSDILQYFGHHENIICYGLLARNIKGVQNFFFDHVDSSFNNMAFVNIAINNIKTKTPVTQFNSSMHHVLFYHISNINQPWTMRNDMTGNKKFIPDQLRFTNCVLNTIRFMKPTNSSIAQHMKFESCHFSEETKYFKQISFADVKLNTSNPNYYRYSGLGLTNILDSGKAIEKLPYPSGFIGQNNSVNIGAFSFLRK